MPITTRSGSVVSSESPIKPGRSQQHPKTPKSCRFTRPSQATRPEVLVLSSEEPSPTTPTHQPTTDLESQIDPLLLEQLESSPDLLSQPETRPALGLQQPKPSLSDSTPQPAHSYENVFALDLAPSSTPVSSQIVGLSGGFTKTRVRLSETDILLLVQMCAEYRADWATVASKKFWDAVGGLFEGKTGRRPRDVKKVVQDRMKARRSRRDAQLGKSGTVQEETDLSQALDLLLERQNELQQEETVKAEKRAQKAAEVAETRVIEGELMRESIGEGRPAKRDYSYLYDNDDDLDLATDIPDQPSVGNSNRLARSASRGRGLSRGRKIRRRDQSEEESSNTGSIVSALERVASALSSMAVPPDDEAETPLEKRINGLESNMEGLKSNMIDMFEFLRRRLPDNGQSSDNLGS